MTGEVKKGLQGSVFFILAFTVLLFSSFFFFFFLAEMLDTWVPRWLAFLIVFLIMVVTTAILALLGYLRVRKLRLRRRRSNRSSRPRTSSPPAAMTTQSRRSISTRAGSESDRKWQPPQIHPPSGSTAPGFTGTFTPTASGFTSSR